MFILYAYLTALSGEHIKMQSLHDNHEQYILAAIEVHKEMPELNFKCVLAI